MQDIAKPTTLTTPFRESKKNLGFRALLVFGPPELQCSLVKIAKKNLMVVYHTICTVYPFIHNNGILQFFLKVIFSRVLCCVSNCA